MSKCDTCKVEESIVNSNIPACCKWYMENVVIGGRSEDDCTMYEPVGTLAKVVSKLDSHMFGHILRWIDDNTFIASVINRFGTRGEMVCHKDYWTILEGE